MSEGSHSEGSHGDNGKAEMSLTRLRRAQAEKWRNSSLALSGSDHPLVRAILGVFCRTTFPAVSAGHSHAPGVGRDIPPASLVARRTRMIYGSRPLAFLSKASCTAWPMDANLQCGPHPIIFSSDFGSVCVSVCLRFLGLLIEHSAAGNPGDG